jgi:hypothetical protein
MTDTKNLIAATSGLAWLEENADTAPLAELKTRRSAARAAAVRAYDGAGDSAAAFAANDLLVHIDRF